MKEVLVVANRTLGGRQAARGRARARRPDRAGPLPPRGPPEQAVGGSRDLRRGRARIGSGARRPRALRGRRPRASRPAAKSATPTRSSRRWTPIARAHARRDHHLHAPRHPVGLAASRPARAHPERLGAPRGAHRDRPRARGAAVQGDARARQQDLQRRGAHGAPQGEDDWTARSTCSSPSSRSSTAAVIRPPRRAPVWRRCSTAWARTTC